MTHHNPDHTHLEEVWEYDGDHLLEHWEVVPDQDEDIEEIITGTPTAPASHAA